MMGGATVSVWKESVSVNMVSWGKHHAIVYNSVQQKLPYLCLRKEPSRV